jgi:hypothetical protein
LYSQDYSGKWNEHYSYLNITGISSNGKEVLASAENAIFKHNISNTENTKTSSIEGLTGEKISTYYYSDVYDTSVIGYENGLIEIVSPEGILSVVDILNKQSIAPNIKKINHIYELNDDVYLSCDFGIVKYNLDRLEFVDTYLIGNTGGVISVKQTTVKDEYIYAATEEGIKRAIYSDSNIIDYSLWETINTPSTNWKSIVTFNDNIYAINSGNSLYYNYNGNSFDNQINLTSSSLDHRVSNGKMLITSSSETSLYETPFSNILTINNLPEYNTEFTVSTIINNNVYVGTSNNGVLNFNLSNGTLAQEIKPSGPKENKIFAVTAQNNEAWIVYGNYSVSGNPYPLVRKGYSFLKNDIWTNKTYDDILINSNIEDVTSLVSIAVNPFNTNQVFISSFFSGLLEVNDGVATNIYNNTNSSLESLGPFLTPPNPNYIDIRIGKSLFDDSGLLWLTNGRVNNAVKSYDIQNNIWKDFSLQSVIADPINDENLFSDIQIDNNNNKWIATRKNGVIGLSENNGNPIIRNLTTQNGNLPINTIQSLAIDNDNNLWIGTREGLRVLYNPSRFFESNNIQTESIIILENGIPQELMLGQSITDIKVDGANNKWISTLNSGVFCFSPDGQQTIYKFTKDNSPLPTNAIIDMSIDQTTGEIYFATEKGMVSFNSNATSSSDNLDNVVIQPNPVRPNYDGNIIIKGLVDGANIKITDISGNLVNENTVSGGTYEWNQTAFGKYKVASGVYIIMITTEDGEETTVEKVMIVR